MGSAGKWCRKTKNKIKEGGKRTDIPASKWPLLREKLRECFELPVKST